MPLSDSDMCVPALLGMEYPDPMGSGLSVPVLGCQTDLISGITIPLAGTMEDPDGKGTVKMIVQVSVYLTHLLNSRQTDRLEVQYPFLCPYFYTSQA